MTYPEIVLATIISLTALCVCIIIILRGKELQRQRDRLQLAELRDLTPDEFEAYIARLFKCMGYTVTDVPNVKDHGVDVVARKRGHKTIIQCKRYAAGRVVGEPTVRNLLGTMTHERADAGIIVTTGGFSGKAREWAARHKEITLIDGEELAGLAQRAFSQ